MKALSKSLSVSISVAPSGGSVLGAAELALGVEQDQVSMRTVFRRLDACGEYEDKATATCVVSIKDFSKTVKGISVLAAQHAVETKLALVPEVAMFVNMVLADGSGSIVLIHSIFDSTGSGGGQPQQALEEE
jgi:hypothetical protein